MRRQTAAVVCYVAGLIWALAGMFSAFTGDTRRSLVAMVVTCGCAAVGLVVHR